MFNKFASNVLQDISDECMLKSFACADEEKAELYRSVSSRIDWVIGKLGVEQTKTEANKEHG